MVRVVVLGCTVTIVCATVATGATRFSTVEETDQIAPTSGSPFGSQVSQIPRCPGEKTAVSGGFLTEYRPGDPSTPSVIPTVFRRAQNKWYAGYANFGPTGGAVTTFVYCLKTEVKISFVPMRAAGPTLSNSARCRSGDVALAGGFVLDTATPVFDLRRASKREWTVSVANPAATEAGLSAYVVCGKPKKTGLRPSSFSAEAPFVAAGTGSTATARAYCPVGSTPVSGGFSVPPGVVVHESRQYGTRRWSVTASSATPISGNLTAYAYCV
jgi:hypothetical protein